MDDQSSKKITFKKSSLFSLKAELLRKQEEVLEKKRQPQHKIENFKPATKVHDSENVENSHKKTFKEKLKSTDSEELEACRKSKLALEKKAQIYEHLSDNSGSSQLAGRFLVDFETKKRQEITKPAFEHPAEALEDEKKKTNCEEEEEWVEFKDCLGRTRKCHKTDLEMYIQRDKDLIRIINKDKISENSEPEVLEQKPEKPFLVQKTNDYLQSLREKWEKKEKDLLAKEKDIHYQDLLFDEARIHGVGYYSFSTDETERQKQMEELVKSREETLKMQKEAEEARAKRDALMAARVAAARARQRARAGLPPEEPEQNQKDFTTCLLEFLTQHKNEADAKAKEEERKQKEELEKERQKLREQYVREWDLGKEGVKDKVEKFREMSQEEYVEQQRNKRIDEFAPPKSTTSDQSSCVFDEQGRIQPNESETYVKTWSDVRQKLKTPPPPDIGDVSQFQTKGLHFSTKKDVKYKNFQLAQETTPIVNELSDDETEDTVTEKRKNDDGSFNVPPPPTYEYYGPVPKKTKLQNPFKIDVRDAFAQGSKSLKDHDRDRQPKLNKDFDFIFD